MANSTAKSRAAAKKPPIVEVAAEDGDHIEPPPEVVEPDPEMSPEEAEEARKDYLLTRFWISARGFWGKNGDRLAWILTLGLLVLIVANVGFSNRPFGVKRFQTIHHHSVEVAHGLVLLFGIGTKAL